MKLLSSLLLAASLLIASCGKDDPAPIEVGSVELSETLLVLAVGDRHTLRATVLPENAEVGTVVWRSGDTNVVDVSDAGLVTALGVGTATVTATAGGKSATCAVTVEPISVESIEIDQTKLHIQRGRSYTLRATVLPADADDRIVTWQSSATEVATVSEEGFVRAVDPGLALITATAGGKSAACTVTVTPDVNVVGYSGSDLLQSKGIFWKNGVATELPCSQANSVFVHEGDVYVTYSIPAICLYGEDLYMAGTGREETFVWKECVKTVLRGGVPGTVDLRLLTHS